MSKEIINVFRSPLTSCWDGDLDSGIEKIDDNELSRIAASGYNGLWIHQPLRDYTPSRIFPEFGADSERYLRLLDAISVRAARHRMRIYMYLLEPRAMLTSDSFWNNYPELKGQHFFQPGFDLNYYALCSSRPIVQEYIYDSLKKISSMVDMSFFAITAAEDFNTCIGKLVGREQSVAIHGTKSDGGSLACNCPLCSERTGAEIISELLNTMNAGIKAGNPAAELIAWDWGWRKLPWRNTEKEILDAIDRDIIYVSDFEIGGKRFLPKEQNIYEYSLGYVGPSENYRETTAYAAGQKRRFGVKLQVGTTHELASVPNLPLIHNLWEKIVFVKNQGASACIATWNLGTYLTLNTHLFGQSMNNAGIPAWDEFLRAACAYLEVDKSDGELLSKAWSCFEKAMELFPFSVPMLYVGPMNYAPAFWLPPEKTQGRAMGMSCHMVARGDNLDACFGQYSVDEVIGCFDKVVRHWAMGLEYYEQAFAGLAKPGDKFMEEYNNARCILHVYQSSLNLFKVYRLCRAWDESMIDEYMRICADEISNCRTLLPVLKRDARLGMHLECKGYMFDFDSVDRKIKKLEALLEPWSRKQLQTAG